MKPSTLFYGLVAPIAVSAFDCLNEDHDHDIVGITAEEARTALSGLRERALVPVDLYFHILVANNTPDVSTYGPGIHAQVEYMQKQFNPFGWTFNLKSIDATFNAEWASDIDVDKTAKMKALHKGDYKTLNIYAVQGANSGVCSLPNSDGTPINQTQLEADGCFVPLGVAINGSSATVTHETGHWFGLYHVFQGGCTGDGDFCNDTAPQAQPSYGKLAIAGDINSCPAPDTCPNQPGRDNVNNFMDYSDCAHEFTSCQGGRMVAAWNNYRVNRKLADGVTVNN